MVALSFPSLTSVPLLYCVSSVQELTEERIQGFPGGASGQESVWQCRRHKGHGFDPWVGKIPWRRARRPAAGQNPVNRKAWWATALRVAKQPNTTEATQHTHKKGCSRAPWTFLFHRALLPPFCVWNKFWFEWQVWFLQIISSCALEASRTGHGNGVRRTLTEPDIARISCLHTHSPLSQETSLPQHKFKDKWSRDFSGGPLVKTLPSNAGGEGSIPSRGTKIPHALGSK